MKQVKVETSILKNALKIALKVVDKKSRLPILQYMKCEVKRADGLTKLTISASDSENYTGEGLDPWIGWDESRNSHNSVNITIPCQAKDEFIFLLHYEEAKFIDKLEEKQLTISYDEITFHVQLLTHEDKLSLTSQDFRDFPCIPTGTKILLGSVGNEFFTEIKTCLNYISKDELRPAMTGMLLKIENGKIVICATDSHLLRTANLYGKLNSEADGDSVIMNPGLCKHISSVKNADDIQISKMGTGVNAHIVITYTTNKGHLAVEIISRNIMECYPDYKAVIPVTHTTEVRVNKKDLLKRIDKALLYTTYKTNYQGIFSINGKLSLTASDLDLTREYKAEFDTFSKTGSDIDIAFNLQFLKMVLDDFKGESVSMELSKPNRAAVIRDENALTLLMPIK